MAHDRDRLRQEILEGLGLRLHRIWGLSWYRELGAKAARIYGWARRGAAIQLALEGAVEELVARGVALVRGEGRVLVAG